MITSKGLPLSSVINNVQIFKFMRSFKTVLVKLCSIANHVTKQLEFTVRKDSKAYIITVHLQYHTGTGMKAIDTKIR